MRGQTKRRSNSGRPCVQSLTVSATGEAPRLVTSLYELLEHAQRFTRDDDEAVALVSQIVNTRQARMGRSRVRIEDRHESAGAGTAMWLVEADPR
jgi:hypothetical protein